MKLIQTIKVIFDCRKQIRIARKNKQKINTKFLAHIASVPEWTITILNK